jgi:FtsP/CotA-like multicopper oxidase with cupredoxin domain
VRGPPALLLAVLALLLPAGLTGCGLGEASSIQPASLSQPLPIPPLAPSTLDEAGRRVFSLDVQQGSHDFGAGTVPGTWGANGSGYLGPTLRAERGEQVLVQVSNGTDESTTLHWHGMRVPARMDGGPHQMVEPGQTWSPSWTVDQPAATLWYHPHPHGRTAEQVYRGLAGLFYVDDPAATSGLPGQYGVDDIPLVVQDKSFTPDGRLDFGTGATTAVGFIGDRLVVNGALGPYLDVTTQAVRLRLLNASTGRVYRFALSDGRPFHVVASDGGLLAAPVRTSAVQLSPAERAEIVVSMSAGETIRLVSRPPELGARLSGTELFGREPFDVLELRAADELRRSPPLPDTLVELPDADRAQGVDTREFVLGGRTINKRLLDMQRIDEAVPLDQAEVWRITNQTSLPHNFHVHDGQFRVLSLDGSPPPPELAGWKDTVYVEPTTTAEILVRFRDHHDPQWPYMVHCHLMIHEDQGMMAQFVVLAPGEVADPSVLAEHADHGG